jgi:hypothetical protein
MLGLYDQVDMVGFQATRIDFALEFIFPFLQVVEIKQVNIIGGENHLPVVPPFNDVMRIVINYDPCVSLHNTLLPKEYVAINR